MTPKRLKELMPIGAEAATLAACQETTEVGRILFHAFATQIETRTKQYRTNIQINPVDATEDIRFKLGEIKGLQFLEELVAGAIHSVNQPRQLGESP